LTTPADYVGFYVGTSATAPATYQYYSWYKIKGEKGDVGEHGATGSQGAKGDKGDNFPFAFINSESQAKSLSDATPNTFYFYYD
jgi:hypothetical protein